VPVVWCGDADGVDIVSGHDLTEVGVGEAVSGASAGVIGVELFDHVEGMLASLGIDIANGSDFDISVEEIAEEAAILLAHADKGHIDQAVGAFGGSDSGGQNKGCGKDSACGVSEKSPSGRRA